MYRFSVYLDNTLYGEADELIGEDLPDGSYIYDTKHSLWYLYEIGTRIRFIHSTHLPSEMQVVALLLT